MGYFSHCHGGRESLLCLMVYLVCLVTTGLHDDRVGDCNLVWSSFALFAFLTDGEGNQVTSSCICRKPALSSFGSGLRP